MKLSRQLVCGMALTLALAVNVAAQTQKTKLPDTPAGKRMAQMFAAIESSDPAVWKKFAAEGHAKSFLEKRSVEDVTAMLQQMHERQGGFDLLKIEKSEPCFLSVQARNKEAGMTFWVDVRVEEKEPHGIVGVGLDTAPPDNRPKGGPGKVVVKQ